MTSTFRAGKTSSFEMKNGIVRKYVMSIAHDTITLDYGLI